MKDYTSKRTLRQHNFLPPKLRERRDLCLKGQDRAAFHDYASAALRAMRRGDVETARHFAIEASVIAAVRPRVADVLRVGLGWDKPEGGGE